jgi:hypothetical protein
MGSGGENTHDDYGVCPIQRGCQTSASRFHATAALMRQDDIQQGGSGIDAGGMVVRMASTYASRDAGLPNQEQSTGDRGSVELPVLIGIELLSCWLSLLAPYDCPRSLSVQEPSDPDGSAENGRRLLWRFVGPYPRRSHLSTSVLLDAVPPPDGNRAGNHRCHSSARL